MRKDEYEFVAVLQREHPQHPVHETVRIAMLLMRYGASLNRLAVHDCNVGNGDREYRKIANLRLRIEALLQDKGIKPRFSGDPRGACLKLILPSGIYNSLGGREEGYCVPRS